MNGNARILWVDDDRSMVQPYVSRLRGAGFDVQYLDNVDEAVREIEHKRPYDLIIWDMAMPPGLRFAEMPTQGGFQTGRLFHDLVRRNYPDTLMLLFTNYKTFVRDWSNPNQHDYALTKRDVPPSHLVRQISHLLSTGPFSAGLPLPHER